MGRDIVLRGHDSGGAWCGGSIPTNQRRPMKLLIIILMADALNETIKWLLAESRSIGRNA